MNDMIWLMYDGNYGTFLFLKISVYISKLLLATSDPVRTFRAFCCGALSLSVSNTADS